MNLQDRITETKSTVEQLDKIRYRLNPDMLVLVCSMIQILTNQLFIMEQIAMITACEGEGEFQITTPTNRINTAYVPDGTYTEETYRKAVAEALFNKGRKTES